MSSANEFSNSRRNALKGLGAGALIATLPARSVAQTKLQKLTVFTGTTPQFANLYVAHEKGFFEKEGLPVEVTMFSSGSVASGTTCRVWSPRPARQGSPRPCSGAAATCLT